MNKELNSVESNLLHVAADECQQDWDRLEYRDVYYEAFIDGGRYMMEYLKPFVYEVDQGEGGARVTYKELLMGAESSAKAWKAAYKTHKAEVERLKAEIVDLKNELYECDQGEK